MRFLDHQSPSLIMIINLKENKIYKSIYQSPSPPLQTQLLLFHIQIFFWITNSYHYHVFWIIKESKKSSHIIDN